MQEAFKLQSINRSESDQKYLEADDILKKIKLLVFLQNVSNWIFKVIQNLNSNKHEKTSVPAIIESITSNNL